MHNPHLFPTEPYFLLSQNMVAASFKKECPCIERTLIQGRVKGGGGTTRNRTGDTRIFSPLLYQLSYGTIHVSFLRVQRYVFLSYNPYSSTIFCFVLPFFNRWI